MYCGNRFGFDFVSAGLRWRGRSRRLRNFGAEPPESTQPHQNHKPVFAECYFLVKKKKRKKKLRKFLLLRKKVLVVVYFTTKIYKIVTFRYTIKYKRNIYIILVDLTLNTYYIVTKKIVVYLYNKYIY